MVYSEFRCSLDGMQRVSSIPRASLGGSMGKDDANQCVFPLTSLQIG